MILKPIMAIARIMSVLCGRVLGLIFLVFLLSSYTYCQNESDDFYDDDFLRYTNHIYKDSIFTIQLHKEGWELSYPIINLNSQDKLVLSFDDLDTDIKNYSYTFEHCNAEWQSSGLMQAEFIQGFIENDIRDYAYSFNTTYQYVHYRATFPNEDMQFTCSGNYIVKVYEDYDQENLVLTRRFTIVEPKVSISANVKQATLIDERKFSQEIDFSLVHTGIQVDDPYSDIKVVITQNNRWDNAKFGLKPLLVKDNELIYDYDEDNIFDGGSEFRNFDMKSIRYQTQYISEIEYKKPFYHVKLLDDETRRFKVYFTDQDLNGRYYVKIDEGEDFNVEADYVYVYFTLPYDEPIIDGNIYVFGALSNWNFNQFNQMIYNYDKKAYQLKLLLKQGYYNYEYAYVKDGTDFADHSYIEGSHYETENDYIIYVYYRNIRSNYDRLVGMQIVNSIRKSEKQ